ncbi:unnamed protein product [Protopolystoma xenopodis]|uniref:Uncharacterized protein n=1 Tax=Protopolystoma xenopodis TaxID=117903 RepID=A0A448WXW3_9PLAT|nr:unnamed protein product [Protopolystoma xenopodis]
MRARRLDPSCAIGFFCSQPTDISALLDRLPALTALACTPVTRSGPKSSDNFPLFSKKSTIGDSKPADSRFQVASTTASHNTSRPFNSKTFKLDLLDRPNFNTTSQSPPARLIPKRSLIEVFDSPLDLVTSRRIPNKAGNGRLVDMAEHENLKSMFRYLDETSLLVDPEAAIVVSSESAN